MAGKKANLKALFSNTRSRVIIVFTSILLVIAVVVGIIKFSSMMRPPANASARLSSTPGGIQSVPGAINPTAQYAALQQKQNIEQAQQAAKTGRSAIPTIIRAQAFGQGVESVGPQNGEGGVGFAALSREENNGPQQSLWLQTLKDANCSKTSVDSVVSQGAVLKDLKAACTCIQLKYDGYKFPDLRSVCSCKELKAAGFNARQFKEAGYTAGRLRECGFDACELRGAGFTAEEMKDGGFSDGELKGAGFSDNEIARAGGLPDGITAEDVRKAGCSVDGLSKLRASGVSAAAIRRISGCSAAQMKAAGFTAEDLKNAGFSAADLLKAGFTPEQLKAAGYSARDLLNAGFTPAELAAAGFTPEELKAAEAELPPGVTPESLKANGCSVDVLKRERLASVSAMSIRQYAGCSAEALKAAGFTDNDLANAGFTAAQIRAASAAVNELAKTPVSDAAVRAAGCDPKKLHELFLQGASAEQIHKLNGCSAEALKMAGFSAKDLANAGFTPEQLLAAGFTPEELKAAEAELPPGVTPESLKANGCSVDVLKRERLASVSAMSIRQYAGCSAEALKAAGFTDNDLARTHVSDAAVRAAGCDPKKLHELFLQGASAEQIHKLNGCSAEALKMAGFSAKDLANAGFTPEQLLAAGYTPEQLKQAGLSAASIIAAGRTADCSVASLKAARSLGVSALTIKQTLGCSAKQMKEAGYTAAELKAAGFTAADLKDAGFSAQDLKNAGFSAKELRAAGFNAQQLKDAGFTASQLKSAGFSAGELKNAGFTAAQLKALGFTAKELKDAGYSADELRKAGFSAKEMKDAGFTASQLKNAGYSAQEIQNAGFSANDAAMAGLEGANPPPTLASVVSLPSFGGGDGKTSAQKEAAQIASTKQLQEILKRQQTQIADQRYQQKIQAKTMSMLTSANQDMQSWKTVSAQTYMAGTPPTAKGGAGNGGSSASNFAAQASTGGSRTTTRAIIKTGDILFAVIDTSVNSDEPGPILATVVSGKLKGAKLIGSFTLPSNANKMVITFRTMSVPGAANVTTINAYAIDPNTARTALSSRTNHHYLSRYGSLFAATFLEGFGNAFQSANTTITVGGTGSVANTTIQNGVGRSILENAVIGLATLGKSWGQIAMQNVNRPITVDLYSGTGIGVLFTQDVASI